MGKISGILMGGTEAVTVLTTYICNYGNGANAPGEMYCETERPTTNLCLGSNG